MWMPKLWVRRPSDDEKKKFLASCQGFNYDQKYVGATSKAPWSEDEFSKLKQDGFRINHACVKLGTGQEAFTKARDALQHWRHVQLNWVSVDPRTPVEVGGKFGIVVHEMIAWLINPLQITYLSNSHEGETKKSPSALKLATSPGQSTLSRVYAFSGGTLHGHLLAGEERFAVEWNKEDDSVWYEILSFSKPAHFLAVAGFPLVALQQKLFAQQSTEAMMREVTVTNTAV